MEQQANPGRGRNQRLSRQLGQEVVRLPASQPYLQVPCLSWIPGMWNATTDHGGADEFPLDSTYQPTYVSSFLPTGFNYLCWIP